MGSITRRATLKYLAALPVASALGLYSFATLTRRRVTVPAPATPSSWNILLHGLCVVQWISPADPNAMRLIFPKVNAPKHQHEYWIGAFSPGNQGYSISFKTKAVLTTPDQDKNIVLPASKLSIPIDSSSLKTVAQCWLDLPRPSSIQALRPRSVKTCGIQFCGTLGSKVNAKIVPSVTLLRYNLDPTASIQITITDHKPDFNKNLIIRSEPRNKPSDNGKEALLRLQQCMTLTNADFETAGDCCPPNPDSNEMSTYGLSEEDESTLMEIAGAKCDPPGQSLPCGTKPKPGQVGALGLQIRACMTVFAA